MRSPASRCRSTATGENVRDWIYVEDHCRAVLAVLRGGRIGETYVVGSRSEKNEPRRGRDHLRRARRHAPARRAARRTAS